MKSRYRMLLGVAALGVAAAIIIPIKEFVTENEAVPTVEPPKKLIAEPVVDQNADQLRDTPVPEEPSPQIANRRCDAPFLATISSEEFETLLAGTCDKSIAVRTAAWRDIAELSNGEKIHWFGEFSKSDDEMLRLAAIRGVRTCFGLQSFNRAVKATYKDMKERQELLANENASVGKNDVVAIDMNALPTKRESAQINRIIRTAMNDVSQDVRKEAVLAASSFDIDTCHTLYQYAMTSCSDDVRLAIMDDAAYGDEDYLLRLQMAALDVGGEEVVRVASEGIEKATGQKFSSSAEAFEWYEENHNYETELVIGEPEGE